MRPYHRDSPQAAARIVALTVFADRDIGPAELQLLDRLAVHEQLCLGRDALHEVLDAFCEDLLSSQQLQWAGTCPVDERTLAGLMGDIEDPALRRKLLRLCRDRRSRRDGDRRRNDGADGGGRALGPAAPTARLTTLL